jgi:penicillin-binding protein 2
LPTTDVLLSMFHRRLLLLLGASGLGLTVLGAQLGRLTIAHGEELRDRAEAQLVSQRWLPTARGSIVDRRGRILAQDRPCFNLVGTYDVISGEWAQRKGLRAAKRTFKIAWRTLDEGQRTQAAEPFIRAYQAHLDAMWETIAEISGQGTESLEAQRSRVIEFVQGVAGAVRQKQFLKEIQGRLERGREITLQFEEDVDKRVERSKVAEETVPHVIARALEDQAGFRLQGMLGERSTIEVRRPDTGEVLWKEEVDRLPGLQILDGGDREYPYETLAIEVDRGTLPPPVAVEDTITIKVRGVATHILGWMRDRAQQEDHQARLALLREDQQFRQGVVTIDMNGRSIDRGRYMPTDGVGAWGLEKSQEPMLRGLRGLESRRLDTGERREVLPTSGRDLQLTLDIQLQARVQAAMSPELGLAVVQPWHRPAGEPPSEKMPDGTPLNGSAVVLEISTGQILAMVSTPTFTREQLRQHPKSIFSDQILTPYVNRAIGRPYPPGSIVKALMLPAAVKLGVHDLNAPIDCTGHLYSNRPDQYRCWIFKNPAFNTTHTAVLGHAPNGPESLMVSCNIYFFTLGQRLGPAGIASAYHLFGLGEPFNLGLEGEFAGRMGKDASGQTLSTGDAVMMGIGQGPIDWTPLHAADAYATLARGGTRIKPSLIKQVGETLVAPGERTDLGLSAESVRVSLEGLWLAVNDARGTGHHIAVGDERPAHFTCPGIDVWGKTGTADASPLVIDPDGEGPEARIVVSDGDHSWFVVLAGPEGALPKYAIAVVMEYAGSGGKVSGPIVNQILYALKAEGYL